MTQKELDPKQQTIESCLSVASLIIILVCWLGVDALLVLLLHGFFNPNLSPSIHLLTSTKHLSGSLASCGLSKASSCRTILGRQGRAGAQPRRLRILRDSLPTAVWLWPHALRTPHIGNHMAHVTHFLGALQRPSRHLTKGLKYQRKRDIRLIYFKQKHHLLFRDPLCSYDLISLRTSWLLTRKKYLKKCTKLSSPQALPLLPLPFSRKRHQAPIPWGPNKAGSGFPMIMASRLDGSFYPLPPQPTQAIHHTVGVASNNKTRQGIWSSKDEARKQIICERAEAPEHAKLVRLILSNVTCDLQ